MRSPKPVGLPVVVRTFEAIPELAGAGALAGANALYLEHIENLLGRFSLDIDLQNQTEEIEAIHRRFSPRAKRKLRLVSRLNADIYEYQTRVDNQTVRIEIAKPYLRHQKKYQPSQHIPGLAVVSLDDLVFAKISAFSTRGFARDLIDLFAAGQQRNIDWRRRLHQAAHTSDNDYNPSEFHRKLKSHYQECATPSYIEELPVTKPPALATLRQFINILLAANQAVAHEVLEQSELNDEGAI